VLTAVLLTGLIALALRILPLLSGFLPATLLLTGALAGVLVLLARILVLLLRHWGNLPCLDIRSRITAGPGFGCLGTPVPSEERNRDATSVTK
jgi:hypothetical protein